MFHLKFLCKNSNVHLLRQLRVWPLEARTVGVRFFRISSTNQIPNACESGTTSNERKPETCISSLKQSIREQVHSL